MLGIFATWNGRAQRSVVYLGGKASRGYPNTRGTDMHTNTQIHTGTHTHPPHHHLPPLLPAWPAMSELNRVADKMMRWDGVGWDGDKKDVGGSGAGRLLSGATQTGTSWSTVEQRPPGRKKEKKREREKPWFTSHTQLSSSHSIRGREGVRQCGMDDCDAMYLSMGGTYTQNRPRRPSRFGAVKGT